MRFWIVSYATFGFCKKCWNSALVSDQRFASAKRKKNQESSWLTIFVTSRNGDVGIIPLHTYDSLNAISNQVVQLKAVTHALCTHREMASLTSTVLKQKLTMPASFTSSLPAKWMHVASIALIQHRWNPHPVSSNTTKKNCYPESLNKQSCFSFHVSPSGPRSPTLPLPSLYFLPEMWEMTDTTGGRTRGRST